MKKEWSKPKLIILFKGSAQDSVLGYCMNGSPGPAPNEASGWCQKPTSCVDCQSRPDQFEHTLKQIQ